MPTRWTTSAAVREAAAQRPLCLPHAARCAWDPLLRVFEGCARKYLGEIEGQTSIKLSHRQSGKVSYLVYPDFETNPHPALLRSVKLSLRTREIDSLEYGSSPNPPVRRETSPGVHGMARLE